MDRRITKLALRALEDVVAQGQTGEVERTWGTRLALELLLRERIAEPAEVKKFWRDMAAPIYNPHRPVREDEFRENLLNGSVAYWHNEASIERAGYFVRQMWARAYGPELIDSVTDRMNHQIMCNRAKPGRRERVTDLFSITKVRTFNAGPAIIHKRDPAPIVRLEDGERILDQAGWGFPVVLTGKRGQPLKPTPVNNARFDKLNKFWKQWAMLPKHRCLLPTEAFAEAVGTPGEMTTTWLRVKSQPVFAWAGLWAVSDEWGEVCTGVMTSACAELRHIHDRSPVILRPADWDTWLNAPLDELNQFDRPWPAKDIAVMDTNVLWTLGGDISAYHDVETGWDSP